jgi:hypothetical protein
MHYISRIKIVLTNKTSASRTCNGKLMDKTAASNSFKMTTSIWNPSIIKHARKMKIKIKKLPFILIQLKSLGEKLQHLKITYIPPKITHKGI